MKNALESAVRSVFSELRSKQPGFCTCPECEDDVIAYALNNVKPRYVSGHSPVGEVVTGVHLSYDQARAELTVVILEAMKRVASQPRHAAKSRPGGSAH